MVRGEGGIAGIVTARGKGMVKGGEGLESDRDWGQGSGKLGGFRGTLYRVRGKCKAYKICFLVLQYDLAIKQTCLSSLFNALQSTNNRLV